MRQTGLVHPKARDALLPFYPLRARIIRPATDGRFDTGALDPEEEEAADTVLHDDVPCARRFEPDVRGIAGRATLTEGRVRAHATMLGVLADVLETDNCVITDAEAGVRDRFRIRAPGFRESAGVTFMGLVLQSREALMP